MKQQEYESLISRLESQAATNPKAYRLKLGALAAVGYGYVALVILALLAAIVILLWRARHGKEMVLDIKFAFVLGVLAWAAIRAMFVKIQPPTGREIHARDAPELFAEIERLRAEIGAPPVYKVLIDDEFNAAVMQYSRYGIFGGTQNYLLLGLPLLQGLSTDEFRAILAHEFGHLSGAHGKFGAWIYRLRLGWARLTAVFEESENWGRHLFTHFLDWYAPKFAAYSFVQARSQEYEADRLSAQVSGPAVTASALIRLNLQGQFLAQQFWPSVFGAADTRERPDIKPFSSLQQVFADNQKRSTSAPQTLSELLTRKTTFDDTHPCLRDRLSAIQIAAEVPRPIEESAAHRLLGAFAQQVAAEFDSQWQENVAEWWERKRSGLRESQEALAKLDASASADRPPDEAFKRAELTERLGNSQLAMSQLESLLQRAPLHAAALLMLGRLKLVDGDENGIALLDKAMELDEARSYDACTLIINFLHARGRNEAAHSYIDRRNEALELNDKARRDRMQVHHSDDLRPHQYSDEQVAALIVALRDFPVRRAYLVQKVPKYFPEEPLHVLAVVRKAPFWKFESGNASLEFAQLLVQQLPLPGASLVACLDSDARALHRKFKRMPTALIYKG